MVNNGTILGQHNTKYVVCHSDDSNFINIVVFSRFPRATYRVITFGNEYTVFRKRFSARN